MWNTTTTWARPVWPFRHLSYYNQKDGYRTPEGTIWSKRNENEKWGFEPTPLNIWLCSTWPNFQYKENTLRTNQILNQCLFIENSRPFIIHRTLWIYVSTKFYLITPYSCAFFPITKRTGQRPLWFKGLTLSSKNRLEFCQLLFKKQN